MAKTSQSDTSSHEKTASATKVKKRTRKSVPRDSPLQRSSVHRGVTRHRWTGRYEAHLWDKNCWNESQNKKGRQVYLGAYDDEEAAAHAYDLAALKYWGPDTILNFPLSTYEQQVKEMEGQSREEYIGSLRRKSSGFSRGVSKYRGVARHHHNGRWEARIGRVFGNKYLYLGTYGTQEEAAMAYDMAAIEYRGVNAVTNFDLSRYIKWLRPAAPKSDQEEDTVVVVNDPAAATATAVNNNVPKSMELITRGSSASSALGLLLQSSKFKEMLEMTSSSSRSTTDDYGDGDDDDSPPPPSSTAESDSNNNLVRPRKSFPDDIQTYFHCCQDAAATTFDDTIFADLNSFASPIFNSQLVDN